VLISVQDWDEETGKAENETLITTLPAEINAWRFEIEVKLSED
jgi:hypothetical protein